MSSLLDVHINSKKSNFRWKKIQAQSRKGSCIFHIFKDNEEYILIEFNRYHSHEKITSYLQKYHTLSSCYRQILINYIKQGLNKNCLEYIRISENVILQKVILYKGGVTVFMSLNYYLL